LKGKRQKLQLPARPTCGTEIRCGEIGADLSGPSRLLFLSRR